MLTKYYPFGKGEEFIENEIEIAAKYFENITIVACEVGKKEASIRKLPDNVDAFKVPTGSRIKNVLLGMKYLFDTNDMVCSERTKCKGMIQKIFLGYFEEKSQSIYKYIVNKNYISGIVKKPFAIYSYWMFTTARVGLLIADKDKPIYKFTRTHRYDLYQERNRLNYLPYRRLFLQGYDVVFPCSDNGTEYLKSTYPDCSDHIKTAFLGTKDHGLSEESRDGVFRIISCSRVEPVKRVHRIMEALCILEDTNMDIEWVHIGDGTGLEKIKKKARSALHHIKPKFTGHLSNPEVLDLYKSSPVDLFINVSSSEGIPVSIMEAISFGIPVIGTDVGGTSEIVIPEVSGWLIPSDFTNERLAAEIKKVYEKKELHLIRKSCRKYWEKHFQAELNYHNMFRYLKKNII